LRNFSFGFRTSQKENCDKWSLSSSRIRPRFTTNLGRFISCRMKVSFMSLRMDIIITARIKRKTSCFFTAQKKESCRLPNINFWRLKTTQGLLKQLWTFPSFIFYHPQVLFTFPISNFSVGLYSSARCKGQFGACFHFICHPPWHFIKFWVSIWRERV
jgi:hypothetical protein